MMKTVIVALSVFILSTLVLGKHRETKHEVNKNEHPQSHNHEKQEDKVEKSAPKKLNNLIKEHAAKKIKSPKTKLKEEQKIGAHHKVRGNLKEAGELHEHRAWRYPKKVTAKKHLVEKHQHVPRPCKITRHGGQVAKQRHCPPNHTCDLGPRTYRDRQGNKLHVYSCMPQTCTEDRSNSTLSSSGRCPGLCSVGPFPVTRNGYDVTATFCRNSSFLPASDDEVRVMMDKLARWRDERSGDEANRLSTSPKTPAPVSRARVPRGKPCMARYVDTDEVRFMQPCPHPAGSRVPQQQLCVIGPERIQRNHRKLDIYYCKPMRNEDRMNRDDEPERKPHSRTADAFATLNKKWGLNYYYPGYF